jgi:hypothetical protein
MKIASLKKLRAGQVRCGRFGALQFRNVYLSVCCLKLHTSKIIILPTGLCVSYVKVRKIEV